MDVEPTPAPNDPQRIGEILMPLLAGQEPARSDGFADEAARKAAAKQTDAENWVRDAGEQLFNLIARKSSGEDIDIAVIKAKQEELLEAQIKKHGFTSS